MYQNIGLTGRILFSIWLTLILIIIAVFAVLKLNGQDKEPIPVPPVELHDDLLLKLLNEPYASVKRWFQQQDKKNTRRIFIIKDNQEILNRTLPPNLRRLHKRLSEQRPFIHDRHRGRAMLGRLFLLPNGEQVKILVHTRIGPPPLLYLLLDNVAYLLLAFFIISGGISWLLTRYILKPIIELRRATQQITRGQFDLRLAQRVTQKGEIAALASDFDAMSSALQRSLESHKHLIHDISHELRSPITRLQLACELARKAFQAENDEHFHRMEKEIEQIKAMISTLLNLPAYELEPHLALEDSIDCVELVESIQSDLLFQNTDKPICFRNNLPAPFSQHCIITANAQLLHSAIENVIINALNYHQGQKPIEISLDHKQINNDQYIQFTCCDHGPGIEEQHIENIFKPFYRTSSARDRATGGHGLGLAISKRAIELHGGKILARNRSGSGLCITILLPWELITETKVI